MVKTETEKPRGKPWWTSKTLWVNAVAAIAMLVQMRTGFLIGAEEQGLLLGLVNLVLRAVTNEPLGGALPPAPPANDAERLARLRASKGAVRTDLLLAAVFGAVAALGLLVLLLMASAAHGETPDGGPVIPACEALTDHDPSLVCMGDAAPWSGFLVDADDIDELIACREHRAALSVCPPPSACSCPVLAGAALIVGGLAGAGICAIAD